MSERRRGAEALLVRAEAVHWFLEASAGVVPEERLAPARAVVGRARQRLELSRGHTVVALAGATGSGKSSLFNAVSRLELSAVAVRRPTTRTAHACVWGTQDSATLLDWLGVAWDRRFARESALDADDEAPLRGLVLLDLPDFDSVVDEHRVEVNRLLALVDLVVWVTDPQKYADQVVHEGYLRTFHQHRDVMVVVLNQADRLTTADAGRCVADLRHLLEADGLAGIPVFATSATGPPGIGELRGVLEKAVSARQAALRRLDDDVTSVVSDLADLVGPEPAERGAEEELVDGLLHAAGVSAVADAAAHAYRRRAGQWLRWLPIRPPWRHGSGVTRPVTTQPAEAGLAVRGYADRVSAGLPEPWHGAVSSAARAGMGDLPSALDRALAGTDLGATRTPFWWRLAATAQWLLALAALGGLVWLVAGPLAPTFGTHAPWDPKVGPVPLAAVVTVAALAAGLLLRLILLPPGVAAAHLVQEQALRRLRGSVFEVARQQVVEPVKGLLGRYARARSALSSAGDAFGNDETDEPASRAGHP
jgi:GTP-binding protein EngB required for normal cell division